MFGVPLFLKLLVAHLAGDYLFQSSRVAEGKHRLGLLSLHGALHAALLALVWLTEPGSRRLAAALLVVLAAHLLTDLWTSRMEPRDLKVFALDQSLHLASLVAAVGIARPEQLAGAWREWLQVLARREPWLVVCGALIAVPAGAPVIGRWVRPFRAALEQRPDDPHAGLERAGRWIGMLERSVILAAVLTRAESLVGFVIGVKAVLRLPEARESRSRELAEYYLTGSLASLAWALLTALAVRGLVRGSPS